MAIKVMDPACLRGLEDTFWREAAVLQQCRHPNIVQLLGLYTGDAVRGQKPQQPAEEPPEEEPVLVDERPHGLMVFMELMPGGALLHRLAEPGMRWYCRCGLR